jgi:antitoxin ParD1/3/4
MAKHTTITLGDHFDTFVNTKLETGTFGSVSEVVRAGLRLLEREDREDAAKIDALRAAIERGIASGRAKDSSMESVLAESRARRT